VHYVGAMATKAARRTRSRREVRLRLDAVREAVSDSATPVPLPDEVKLAAIEAVWDYRAWERAKWLGHPVNRYPADLHVYQELLAEIRPDVVVVAADDPGLGGRALFLASLCEQLGHGRVLAVGELDAAERPSHPRLDHLVGRPDAQTTAQNVTALTSAHPSALVLLGMSESSRVVAAFERYAPLVPAGSYVIVENTVVKGRSADSPSGRGPYDAVEAILARHGDFVADPAAERYTLTLNRGGFLRRISD
jgi:cephalosporin hydroxylase